MSADRRPEEATELAALNFEESQEAQAMVMSWADRMKEEGFERGRRETLQEARSWADRMKEEGRLEGIEMARQEARTSAGRMKEEGRKEGRKIGLKEGIRQTLLHQLERRFGPLPPIVLRRVRKIDSVDRLHRLAEQILTARSVDELDLD